MNEELFFLVLAYVFLSALLLLALIYSQINWLMKTGLIVIVVIFWVGSYQGWKQNQGWPTGEELPEKFLLHFAVVEEPDDELDHEGAIYIWLTAIEQAELKEIPRAYQIEYDPATHQKVQEALIEMKNGNLQLGENTSEKIPKEQKSKLKLAGQKYPGLQFVKLPDPALPEK